MLGPDYKSGFRIRILSPNLRFRQVSHLTGEKILRLFKIKIGLNKKILIFMIFVKSRLAK